MLLTDLKEKRKSIKDKYNLEKSKVVYLQGILNGQNEKISTQEKDIEILKNNLKTVLDEIDERDKKISDFNNLEEAYYILKEKELNYIDEIENLKNKNIYDKKKTDDNLNEQFEYYENIIDIYDQKYTNLRENYNLLEEQNNVNIEIIEKNKNDLEKCNEINSNLVMRLNDTQNIDTINNNLQLTIKKNKELIKDLDSKDVNLKKYKSENEWLLKEIDNLFDCKEKSEYKEKLYVENEQKLNKDIRELKNIIEDLKKDISENENRQIDNMQIMDEYYDLEERNRILADINKNLINNVKMYELKEKKEKSAKIIQGFIRSYNERKKIQEFETIDISENTFGNQKWYSSWF